jgi:hypothetical protein
MDPYDRQVSHVDIKVDCSIGLRNETPTCPRSRQQPPAIQSRFRVVRGGGVGLCAWSLSVKSIFVRGGF